MAELQRSLGFNDLMTFGVAAIMGSGGFNLIGDGILAGGAQFPIALAASAALFQGASLTYQHAYNEYKSNTSESDLIHAQFGPAAATVSSITIPLFNIISVSVILVICGKLLFPTESHQITFALCILTAMSAFSLQGIDVNKNLINIFGYATIALLAFVSLLGFGDIPSTLPQAIRSPPDLTKSMLYFFFVLAGFDTLIKFTEEARDPDRDIPRSFYASNALSTLLTVGVCLSFLMVFTHHRFTDNENIMARIVESVLGPTAGEATGFLSILLMIVTTFIVFLATTRYMYGLGKGIPCLGFFTELNEKKVPWKAVLATFVIAAVGILNNNIFTLVKMSDMALIVTLLLVSAAATKLQLAKGKAPLVEAATTAGLAALLSVSYNSS